MSWLNNKLECDKFIQLANKQIKPIAFQQTKMLRGGPEHNVEEILSDCNFQLAVRMEAHRHDLSDPNTHDGQVWRCLDADTAVDLAYSSYLLRGMVRTAVARIRLSQLRTRQSEVLDTVCSPPAKELIWKEEMQHVFSRASDSLSDAELADFTEEVHRRIEQTETGRNLNQNQRQRWSRILRKLRVAVVVSLIAILCGGLFIAPAIGAALPLPSNARGGYVAHRGFIRPSTTPPLLHQGRVPSPTGGPRLHQG